MAKRLIDKADVFATYYRMGPSRSLRGLHDKIQHEYNVSETGQRIPSLATIAHWSGDDRWQDRIKELDGKIEAQVENAMAGQLVQNKVEHLRAAHSILRTAYDVKPDGEIVPHFKINSSRSFKEIVDATAKLESDEDAPSNVTGIQVNFELVDGREPRDKKRDKTDK